MCYRCEGKDRKPLSTNEAMAIWRAGGWEEVEREEVAACRRGRLLGQVSGPLNDPARPAEKPRPKNGGL